MKIKYPKKITTETQRYKYLYKLEEILRLAYNVKGKAYRGKKMTEAEWNMYRTHKFKPSSLAISEEICTCRNKLKAEARNDSSINASLNDIIEE